MKHAVITFLIIGALVPQLLGAKESIEKKGGILPGSPLYVLDLFFETLQERFIRNNHAKARLKIKFAQERLEELELLTSKEKKDTQRITETEKQLETNLTHAEEKSSTSFEIKKAAEEIRAKKAQALQLPEKVPLSVPVAPRKETQEEKARRALKGTEAEQQELLAHAKKEGVVIPQKVLTQFEALMKDAKTLFGAGKYEEAQRKTEEAESFLDRFEEEVAVKEYANKRKEINDE